MQVVMVCVCVVVRVCSRRPCTAATVCRLWLVLGQTLSSSCLAPVNTTTSSWPRPSATWSITNWTTRYSSINKMRLVLISYRILWRSLSNGWCGCHVAWCFARLLILLRWSSAVPTYVCSSRRHAQNIKSVVCTQDNTGKRDLNWLFKQKGSYRFH